MTACKNLDQLQDSVTSGAARAVDSIVATIPGAPTSGTAAAIGAKISSAISTVKAEAESALAAAKGAAATIESTLQEYAEQVQQQIEVLQAAMIGASEEVIEQLKQQIENLKGEVQEVIPSWMNKTPDQLLNDAKNGICDPQVDGVVKPAEGEGKKIKPATPPAVNPAPTQVETYAAPSKPPLMTNPIIE